MKEIEIKMVLTVPDELTVNDLNFLFLDWVESNDWTCGGGVVELDKN